MVREKLSWENSSSRNGSLRELLSYTTVAVANALNPLSDQDMIEMIFSWEVSMFDLKRYFWTLELDDSCAYPDWDIVWKTERPKTRYLDVDDTVYNRVKGIQFHESPNSFNIILYPRLETTIDNIAIKVYKENDEYRRDVWVFSYEIKEWKEWDEYKTEAGKDACYYYPDFYSLNIWDKIVRIEWWKLKLGSLLHFFNPLTVREWTQIAWSTTMAMLDWRHRRESELLSSYPELQMDWLARTCFFYDEDRDMLCEGTEFYKSYLELELTRPSALIDITSDWSMDDAWFKLLKLAWTELNARPEEYSSSVSRIRFLDDKIIIWWSDSTVVTIYVWESVVQWISIDCPNWKVSMDRTSIYNHLSKDLSCSELWELLSYWVINISAIISSISSYQMSFHLWYFDEELDAIDELWDWWFTPLTLEFWDDNVQSQILPSNAIRGIFWKSKRYKTDTPYVLDLKRSWKYLIWVWKGRDVEIPWWDWKVSPCMMRLYWKKKEHKSIVLEYKVDRCTRRYIRILLSRDLDAILEISVVWNTSGRKWLNQYIYQMWVADKEELVTLSDSWVLNFRRLFEKSKQLIDEAEDAWKIQQGQGTSQDTLGEVMLWLREDQEGDYIWPPAIINKPIANLEWRLPRKTWATQDTVKMWVLEHWVIPIPRFDEYLPWNEEKKSFELNSRWIINVRLWSRSWKRMLAIDLEAWEWKRLRFVIILSDDWESVADVKMIYNSGNWKENSIFSFPQWKYWIDRHVARVEHWIIDFRFILLYKDKLIEQVLNSASTIQAYDGRLLSWDRFLENFSDPSVLPMDFLRLHVSQDVPFEIDAPTNQYWVDKILLDRFNVPYWLRVVLFIHDYNWKWIAISIDISDIDRFQESIERIRIHEYSSWVQVTLSSYESEWTIIWDYPGWLLWDLYLFERLNRDELSIKPCFDLLPKIIHNH